MGKRTRSKGVYKGRIGIAKAVPTKNIDDDPLHDAVDHYMKGLDSDEPISSNDDADLAEDVLFDDQSSEESSDEETTTKGSRKSNDKYLEKYDEWGRMEGRGKYHGNDVEANNESYDAAIQEEEEAKYLQEKQVANLKEGDFGVDEDEQSDSDDEFWDEAEQKEKFQLAAKAIENVSLKPGQKTKKRSSAPSPSKKLSEAQKLQIIERDSPELLGLLKDFEIKLGELKNEVQPLLSEVSKKELPTSKGISFLDGKFHLLLNYCMNVGFYMLLKAEGQQVQDHPVISQLVKLRLLLDKIKPIDQKLHYQVQKLLKMSAGGQTDELGEGLQHRPNISAFDQEEEEDESTAVYKPSKVAPTAYDGDLDHKGKKKKQKKVKTDTAMANFIREEFSEAPTETSFTGRAKLTKEEKHEIEFEEDNFMRLTRQAKARRKQEKQLLSRDQLEDPLDFRDITGFGQIGNAADDDRPSRSRLNAIINSVEQRDSKGNTEIDLPYNQWEKRKPLSKRSLEQFQEVQDEEDNFGVGQGMMEESEGEEDISEEEYYEQVRKKHKSNTYEPMVKGQFNDTVDENAKRSIGFQISANKGLRRHRPKNNPRVRYKNAAAKKEMKLKTTGRAQMRDQLAPYAGESTGIRKGVKRSTNIK